MDSGNMLELADRLKALRDEKTALEEQKKRVSKALEKTELALFETMALNDTQNFTRAGNTFFLKTRLYASAAAGRGDDLYGELRKRGFGGLIHEAVHADALASFVKEQLGENKDALPEWLAGLVNVFNKTTVGIRKATKRK